MKLDVGRGRCESWFGEFRETLEVRRWFLRVDKCAEGTAIYAGGAFEGSSRNNPLDQGCFGSQP